MYRSLGGCQLLRMRTTTGSIDLNPASLGKIYDTGYPHDGRADNAAYRHDRRADKRRYPHDREIDIQMLNMFRN